MFHSTLVHLTTLHKQSARLYKCLTVTTGGHVVGFSAERLHAPVATDQTANLRLVAIACRVYVIAGTR